MQAEQDTKLYRTYVASRGGAVVLRHRGKSPHRVAFFFRNPDVLFEATQLAGLYLMHGLLEGGAHGVEARWRCAIRSGAAAPDASAAPPRPARIVRMPWQHYFAGPYLDRATHLREDPAAIEAILAAGQGRAIPVWNTRSLVTAGDPPRAALVDIARLPPALQRPEELILLGQFDAIPCFACALDGEEPPQLVPDARFVDLRSVIAELEARDAGLLGLARALVSWRLRHRYCGTCGAPARAARGGHVALCTNARCGAEMFPRIDPAIIVLVRDGERALLGRQASWPPRRYSTIAGFVEPGESLEDAVMREVLEETGVPVTQVAYHSSQPWPFPASLMLGFTARALATDIHRRDRELEDARWVTREEVIAGDVTLPPGQSISFRLMEQWFDERPGMRLRDVARTVPLRT